MAPEAASQVAAPLVNYVPLPHPHADTHTQIFIPTRQNTTTQDMPIAHAAVCIKTAHLAVATTMGDVHTLKWIVGFHTQIIIPTQLNTTFYGNTTNTSKINVGPIVGGIVGGVVALVVIIALIIW